MTADHVAFEDIKDGNLFASEGLTRVSDTCFLYKCEHCPLARPSDPAQAYKHLATNRDHIRRIDNARSVSAAAAGGPDDGGSDG